jgi:hypothetical protein
VTHGVFLIQIESELDWHGRTIVVAVPEHSITVVVEEERIAEGLAA